MNVKALVAGCATVVVAVGAWWMFSGSAKTGKAIWVQPKKGKFEVAVTVQGELRAKNSIDVTGPSRSRKVGINQMKIARMVDEGTVVKKGDFVAELDRAEIVTKLKEIEINLQKFESQHTQARLDCTLTLSQTRDEIVNLNYALEQRKLEKEESIFEAPSARRTADIEYEKAKRGLDHAKENYLTKVKQAQAKMQEVTADLNKEQNKYEEMLSVLDEFTILAPENGMVIYAKEWGSDKKIATGSTISAWMPTVATLPDLTIMQSKTFVSEVDIQKVKVGLEVAIGLDADPNKRLKGKVSQVANIGEQQQGSDSKWFEVIIDIITEDLTLRPAMTSSNKILISTVDNSIFIRQECVTWEDSLAFVQVQSGNTTKKVPVKLGMSNENEVVVLSGLKGDENLLLSVDDEEEESKEDNQKGNK